MGQISREKYIISAAESIKNIEGMPNHNLSKILEIMMLDRGFTQKSLAEKSGIHVNNIQSWVSGKRIPSYLNLIACINTMGFDLQFVEKNDEKKVCNNDC